MMAPTSSNSYRTLPGLISARVAKWVCPSMWIALSQPPFKGTERRRHCSSAGLPYSGHSSPSGGATNSKFTMTSLPQFRVQRTDYHSSRTTNMPRVPRRGALSLWLRARLSLAVHLYWALRWAGRPGREAELSPPQFPTPVLLLIAFHVVGVWTNRPFRCGVICSN